jgi:hypothetical protein
VLLHHQLARQIAVWRPDCFNYYQSLWTLEVAVLIHATSKTCWICGRAVSLEECKIDEHGLAVHERCCVARLARERKPELKMPVAGDRDPLLVS